jgi:hypothetical protein
MHHFDLSRQNLIEAIPHDGMSLTSANLHQHPGLGYRPLDLINSFVNQALVPVFG